ncbi:MAG: arsenate reductase ArsC [Candidatus Thermoplasmatota archaeon]|nr:arsenate reductase ArsC [Candidatus Thermoplasmatota archaeon]
MPGKLLFICVENAGRSIMAEAFAKAIGLQAESAGTVPASSPNPVVVQVMSEIGLDVSASKPKMLTRRMIEDADMVITMGCSVEQACPKPMIAEMNKKLIDWALEDPKGKSIHDVRKIRDEIQRRVSTISVF